ncbi:MAG: PAS domain S-box protein [Ignavibacteriaceae bacterium]|jgi:PAS domain S-box-containing protein|nr:PAS domain S-box protein [Ignavibacteriaceae bacterium]
MDTSQKKILIVEDNLIVGSDLKRTLEQFGYYVTGIAISGYQAVEIFRESIPDLVLMDVMLKGEHDGIKTVDLLNSIVKVPVIFLTAYSDNDTLKRAAEREPYAYLIKPFHDRELYGAIEMALYKAKAEKVIKLNQERLRLAMDATQDGLWDWNVKKNKIYWSSSAFRMLGYEPNEFPITLEKWQELVHPDEYESVFSSALDQMNSEDGRLEIIFRYKTKSNTFKWINVRGRVIEKINNKIIRVIGTHIDIDNKIRSEVKIKQLSQAIEQSPVSIIITDTEGNIEYANPKFSELTGYSREEVIGKNPRILQSGKSFTDYKKMWKILLEGKTWVGLFVNKKKTGGLFWESAIISPIKNSKGETINYVAVKEDITEKIAAEKELEKYRTELENLVKERTKELAFVNKRLADQLEKSEIIGKAIKESLEKERELNEMKSSFISTTSHEFRTPLASILSSIELLELYGRKWDEEKYNTHIERIKTAIDYLTKLMDDVLILNKAETGKLQLNLSRVNLYKLCHRIIEDVKTLTNEKHTISCSYKMEEMEFQLDEKLIRFIINNLLSNAVKYSPEGGNVDLCIEKISNHLLIVIKDEGIGIPERERSQLFNTFFRCSNSGDIQGNGLGLSIVKKSVDIHGGTIILDESYKSGARFVVTLPLY